MVRGHGSWLWRSVDKNLKTSTRYCVVHKILEDVVQSVFEQNHSPVLVFQNLYLFDFR